jgi:hypothetical protein
VQWVKKLLGPAVGQHVSVEQFLGLDKEFSAEALAETDPFEEELNHAATPPYRVILHGRRSRRDALAPPQTSPPRAIIRPDSGCAAANVAPGRSVRAVVGSGCQIAGPRQRKWHARGGNRSFPRGTRFVDPRRC